MINKEIFFYSETNFKQIMDTLIGCKHPSELIFFEYALIRFHEKFPMRFKKNAWLEFNKKFKSHQDNKWDEDLSFVNEL